MPQRMIASMQEYGQMMLVDNSTCAMVNFPIRNIVIAHGDGGRGLGQVAMRSRRLSNAEEHAFREHLITLSAFKLNMISYLIYK